MVELDFWELLERGIVTRPTFVERRCLRSLHHRSGCNLCFTSCPAEAIRTGYRLSLDEDKCVGCGVCWQVCPTEAWEFPRDPERTLRETLASLGVPSVELVCYRWGERGELPSPAEAVVNVKRCLAALSLPLLLETVISGAGKVWLNDEACQDCPMGSLHHLIQLQVHRANALLRGFRRSEALFLRRSHPGVETRPIPLYQGDEPLLDRRAAFSFLTRYASEMIGDALREKVQTWLDGLLPPSKVPKHLPAQRLRLIRVLARLKTPADEALPVEDTPFGFLEVTDECTACGLCARLCPTGALTFQRGERYFKLEFVPLACVGCDVCSLICPADAVKLAERISLRALLSRIKVTVQEGPLAQCEKCGTLFKSSAGQTLCHICRRQAELGKSLAG